MAPGPYGVNLVVGRYADIESLEGEFTQVEPARGTEAGLRAVAAFPGYPVSAGQTVSLRALGLQSAEFSGRFFRTGFNIVMPPDFYPADYGEAVITLAGGYAPGCANHRLRQWAQRG